MSMKERIDHRKVRDSVRVGDATGRNQAIPVYGTYDVIVSGGGLVGLTCATVLARQGCRVAIVERRSALGWEVGRARCSTVELDQVASQSPLIGELVAELDRWSTKEGGSRASVAELQFDRWAMEAGIDVMFHGWSSRVELNDQSIEGLIVGTREGYRLLNAPLIVETDDYGRLIDEDYSRLALPMLKHRAFYMQNANVGKDRELQLSDGRKLFMRADNEGRARLDMELKAPNYAGRDLEFHAALPEAVRVIREQVEGCGQAAAFYWAEEEWGSPSFQLEDGFTLDHSRLGHLLELQDDGALRTLELTSAHIAGSRSNGLLLAGSWLPSCVAASMGRSVKESQTLSIINRILLGEGVASLFTAQIKQGVR